MIGAGLNFMNSDQISNTQQTLVHAQQQLCYSSFFNQANIVGEPVVKPFMISTPIQSNHNKQYPVSAFSGVLPQAKEGGNWVGA